MSAVPSEQPGSPEPARPAGASQAPGPVLAAAILLYVGGALTMLSGLSGARSSGVVSRMLPPAVLVLYGVFYLLIARGVQQGRRWARTTALVLAGLGVAIGALRAVAAGPAAGALELAWPIVYLILLNTAAARAWFRRPQPPRE